jgi:hypothetical protein
MDFILQLENLAKTKWWTYAQTTLPTH